MNPDIRHNIYAKNCMHKATLSDTHNKELLIEYKKNGKHSLTSELKNCYYSNESHDFDSSTKVISNFIHARPSASQYPPEDQDHWLGTSPRP